MDAALFIVALSVAIFVVLNIHKGIHNAGRRSEARQVQRWYSHERPKQRAIAEAGQEYKKNRSRNAIVGAWEPSLTRAEADARKAEDKVHRSLSKGRAPSPRHVSSHIIHADRKRSILRMLATELGIDSRNNSARVNKATGQTHHGFSRPGQGPEIPRDKNDAKWGGKR